jgi:hypothetical protein
MGRTIVTVAVISMVLLVAFYELFGYLGSGVFQKSEIPLWLRSVETTASIFQATVTGLAFIIGGLFAYYRFFKEEPYSEQLQPSVSTTVSHSANHFLVVIIVTIENAGQVQVRLDKDRTYLLTATRKLGDSGWTDGVPLGIFEAQDAVQPNETISDQVWFEMPDNNEVALRTDFVVAKVVKDVEGLREREEVWGWGARDIVNLLDIKGNITDTSDSDVERGR